MGRILVAGGVEQHQRDLRYALECEGHTVDATCSAAWTADNVKADTWDVLILDSQIDTDPNALCRDIRSFSDLGIIMLIADDDEQSRIDALNAGADDYLVTRFAMPELLAHVRAIMRRLRCDGEDSNKIALGDRAIDLRSHKVRGPGEKISHLTPKEFLVLKCLINHADKPVNHRELAQTVWQRDGSGDLEYVRTVIGQLRKKLEPDWNSPQYILTERSVGYRLTLAAYRTDNQATAQ